MLPFIHIGSFALPTFGILLWFAAVCAGLVLHRNFRRWHVEADALGIVVMSTVAGIVGAKLWHVLETPSELAAHPIALIFSRDGYAWFGGLVAAILALIYQGHIHKIGSLRLLDLCAPAAAIGYGVGRLGCLTSGDGDYGIPTTLPWGMAFPDGMVPTDPGVRVHPTPLYELAAGLLIGWILWRRGGKSRPLGQMTGEYLALSGLARFLVEFIRINPKIFLGMSNAQLASIGSIVAGLLLIAGARKRAETLEN